MAVKFTFGLIIFSVITTILSHPITISQIGDIKIQRDGDNIICDTLVCPTSATRCSVDKKTNADRERITITRKCFDSNNKIVLEGQQVKDNDNPNESVNFHLENGGSNIIINGNDPEAEKFANEITKEIQQELEKLNIEIFKSFNVNY